MARRARTPEQRAQLERLQRSRLLQGMAACAAAEGYAAVTIADVAREARVSKSTFYAHFADKQECFVALYSLTSDRLVEGMAAAHRELITQDLPWWEHVHEVNRPMLTTLQSNPPLSRSLVVETQAAGPDALAMRRDVTERFAKVVRRVSEGLRRKHPELQRVTTPLSLAVVGGNNELIMRALISGRSLTSRQVMAPIDDMWCAVLTSPHDHAATSPARRRARQPGAVASTASSGGRSRAL